MKYAVGLAILLWVFNLGLGLGGGSLVPAVSISLSIGLIESVLYGGLISLIIGWYVSLVSIRYQEFYRHKEMAVKSFMEACSGYMHQGDMYEFKHTMDVRNNSLLYGATASQNFYQKHGYKEAEQIALSAVTLLSGKPDVLKGPQGRDFPGNYLRIQDNLRRIKYSNRIFLPCSISK